MSMLVPIAMFGWIPAVLVLFSLLPPRRAVIAAFLGAWLFLPVAAYPVQGLPDYDKMFAACTGVLLGVLLFDSTRVSEFRLHWLDLPMIIWCLVPFISSVTNGLGAYDGASAVLKTLVTWGLPYLIGRLYFRTTDDLRELAIGFFIGGLLYVPFCLYEIKMSPQLHRMVYGYHVSFANSKRFEGWRPAVFMQDGLMVGMWMVTASLAGIWLWFTQAIQRIRGVSTAWPVLALVVTTILCKSMGALILLLLGSCVLLVSGRGRLSGLFWLVALCPAVYMGIRATGMWSGQEMVSLASSISEERAESLQYRLRCETLLAAKAMKRPLFGWGGWGEWRMTNDEMGNEHDTVSDMLWCIAFGKTGLVGLASLTGVLLLPACLLAWRVAPRYWAEADFGGAVIVATLLVVYMIDNLFNGMVNPIFTLGAGALTSVLAAPAGTLGLACMRTVDAGLAD